MDNIQIGYYPFIIGKPDKVGKWRNEFRNSEPSLSIEDIIDYMAIMGIPTCYVLRDDAIEKRAEESNTLGAHVILLDFDNTCTMEEIQQHPWYKYSAFGFSSASYGKIQEPLKESKLALLPPAHREIIESKYNTPKDNFRLVYIFDHLVPAEELLFVIKGLISLFPLADPACSDLARMYYGAPNAKLIRNNFILNDEHKQYLIEQGIEYDKNSRITARNNGVKAVANLSSTSKIEGDINITLADGHIYSISEIFASFPKGFKSACYSPFRNEDNPSAFVKIFEDNGNVFVFDSGANTKKTWLAKDFLLSNTNALKINKGIHSENDKLIDQVRFNSRNKPNNYQEDIKIITHINERYIPSNLYYDLNESGLIFVKSAKGTGKTELLKTLVERVRGEKSSCLLIGHRVALLNNLSQRLGLDNYQDEDPTKFFALSVDSLQKISEENIGITYNTIIIDEVEQVLNHFKSSTLRKKRKMVFKQFIDKMRAAERIILLDADVSPEITIELIRLIRGSELWASDDTQGIINEYQPGIGRSYNMYQTKEHMIFDLCNLLASDPLANAFVITNSKTLTKEIEQLITGLNLPLPNIKIEQKTDIFGNVVNPDKFITPKVLLPIHSDNSMHSEQQAFITNPQIEGDRYRVVVSSPTISTGVSIDGDHFNHIFGFFNDKPFTFYDCDQAISRVRNKNAIINVWMPEKDSDSKLLLESKLIEYGMENNIPSNTIQNIIDNFNGYDSEENTDIQIHNTAELYKEIELTTRRLSMGSEILTDDELLWVKFLSTLDIVTVNRMTSRKLKFVQYVESNGFNTIDIKLDEDDNNIGKSFMKANKINAKEEEINNIFNAEEIDINKYDELNQLLRIPSITAHEDFLKCRRFEIKEWLNSIDIDFNIDNITAYVDNDLYSKYFHLKYALMDIEAIKKYDSLERDFGKKAIGDMQNKIQIKELLDDLCSTLDLGKNFNEFYQKSIDKEISIIDSSKLELLAESIVNDGANNIKHINKLFKCDLKPASIGKPKWVWDAIFGYVGLELKYKKVRVNGIREYQYSINLSDEKEWIHSKLIKDSEPVLPKTLDLEQFKSKEVGDPIAEFLKNRTLL